MSEKELEFETPIEKIVSEMKGNSENKEFLEELLKAELDKGNS